MNDDAKLDARMPNSVLSHSSPGIQAPQMTRRLRGNDIIVESLHLRGVREGAIGSANCPSRAAAAIDMIGRPAISASGPSGPLARAKAAGKRICSEVAPPGGCRETCSACGDAGAMIKRTPCSLDYYPVRRLVADTARCPDRDWLSLPENVRRACRQSPGRLHGPYAFLGLERASRGTSTCALGLPQPVTGSHPGAAW